MTRQRSYDDVARVTATGLPYFTVDAFAHTPYKGNTATVVLCDNLLAQYNNNSNNNSNNIGSNNSKDDVTAAAMALCDGVPALVLRALAHVVCAVEVAFVFTLPRSFVAAHRAATTTADGTLDADSNNDRNNNDDDDSTTRHYAVRFFTRVAEMPFCGHAAFAAAHVLLNVMPSCHDNTAVQNDGSCPCRDRAAVSRVHLYTRGGGVVLLSRVPRRVTASLTTTTTTTTTALHGADVRMRLRANRIVRVEAGVRDALRDARTDAARTLLACCGVLSDSNGNDNNNGSNTAVHDVLYDARTGNLILVLASAAAVLAARPRTRELPRLLGASATTPAAARVFAGAVTRITLMATPLPHERIACDDASATRDASGAATTTTTRVSLRDIDFVLRLFAPWIGIDEDALSANTQCALACYWCARLRTTSVRSLQASPRGQPLQLTVWPAARADERQCVDVQSASVVVAAGHVLVPPMTTRGKL